MAPRQRQLVAAAPSDPFTSGIIAVYSVLFFLPAFCTTRRKWENNRPQVPRLPFFTVFLFFLKLLMSRLTTRGQSHDAAGIVSTWDRRIAPRRSALTAEEKPSIRGVIRRRRRGCRGGVKGQDEEEEV